MSGRMLTDGSSATDSRLGEPVEIDTSKASTRWRYGCPNGHTTIQPTNGGIWCRSCSRDPEIDDPHHHEIYDKLDDEAIPWSQVEWTDGSEGDA